MFAQHLGWPVFADPRSGLRICEPNVVIAFDSILRSAEFAASNVPDVVLRVGEPPASKVTAQWISRHAIDVVQVSPTEFIIDSDHRMNHTAIAPIAELFGSLSQVMAPVDASWTSTWNAAETVAQSAISEWAKNNWSEPTHARTLTDSLAPGTHFVVSSSMPIRDVEWFGTVTPDVVVHSNRGTNGIDGVISTAVGIAVATSSPTVVFVGDVACLHDSNGLVGLMQREIDVKVVVTNNDGGSIFSFLPQATQVDEPTFELLYGTPHNVSFESLAMAHGIPYHRIADSSSLTDALKTSGSQFIEVPFQRGENVSQHDAVNDAVVSALKNAGLTA
jgi:2-succinyl-5-enolpyruvyl-6-hydroxy-3-cyclohexene-1-carboxylate synthase